MRGYVTVSLSARILVNVEALNMAETVGNVSRHRRAPVVVGGDGRYSIVYVPAVSGESLAHHYQKLLVNIATSMNLPVTKMDKAGYFLKYSSNDIIKKYYDEVVDVTNMSNPCEIESKLVKSSVVADVAGFLYTDKLIRRTSRIRLSYLVPSVDAVRQGAVASYPQLHVRYSPEAAEREQMIYYVESGSALYTLSSILAVSDIAELEYCPAPDSSLVKEKPVRVEAAMKALIAMLDGMMFGAKRARYQPQWEVKSMVVSVSRGPVEFIVSPASNPTFVLQTLRRTQAVENLLGLKIDLYAYDAEGVTRDIPEQLKQKLKIYDTHTEALKAAIEDVLKHIKGGT